MLKIGIVAYQGNKIIDEKEELVEKVMTVLLKGLGKIKHYICMSENSADIVRMVTEMADKMSLDIVLAIGKKNCEIEKVFSIKKSLQISEEVAVGMRGSTLIINLWGECNNMQECFEMAVPILKEGVTMLKGKKGDCLLLH